MVPLLGWAFSPEWAVLCLVSLWMWESVWQGWIRSGLCSGSWSVPRGPHPSQSGTALPKSLPWWWVTDGSHRLWWPFHPHLPTPPSSPLPHHLAEPPSLHGLTQTLHRSCWMGCCPGGCQEAVAGGGDFTSQDSLKSPRGSMKGLDMGELAYKCTCRKKQIS